MTWTDERIELAKKLWTVDGYSSSQIARVLGDGVTRNAVIGRLARMGLTGKGADARRAPYKPTARGRAEPAAREVAELPGLVTAFTLDPHQCKWPIGVPGEQDFTHCGQHVEDGPYCDAHRAIAYLPAEPRKRPTANELARSLRRYL